MSKKNSSNCKQSLKKPFPNESGHCWIAELPGLSSQADTLDHQNRSNIVLYEDNVQIGPAHSLHEYIRNKGGGGYSHWHGQLLFSTSDNSDPNSNGREYHIENATPAETGNEMKFIKTEIEDLFNFLKDPLPVDERLLRKTLETIINFNYKNYYVDFIAQYLTLENHAVLDIGCGNCWFAPFFLSYGAKAYYGVDKYKDLDSNRIENLRKRQYTKQLNDDAYATLPLNLNEFLSCFKNIHVVQQDILDFQHDGDLFDCAVMLTTSEHVAYPREVFDKISSVMKTGGELFINHNNYYSWNGHHFPHPATVTDYNPDDIRMRQIADWNHIHSMKFMDPEQVRLNFIRIHELLEIIDINFMVTKCEKISSTPETGLNRMTPEIRMSLVKYYDDELFTEMLRVVACKIDPEERSRGSIMPECVRLEPEEFKRYSGDGYCYYVTIPFGIMRAEYVLYEDERPLGPHTSIHEDIDRLGEGRYSLWGIFLFFSASDKTDPQKNKRLYSLRKKQ